MNGKSTGAKNDHTLANVSANQTIHATFKRIEATNPQPDASVDDVAADAWYATAIAWAGAKRIIAGKENNTLDPIATATRAEIATMLVRFGELFIK